MGALRRLFEFYLHASIHVALSVYCLILVTEFLLNLPPNLYVEGFGFFGTVVGYNFVKYEALARSGKPEMSNQLRLIIAVSTIAAIGSIFCFLFLTVKTQLISGVFLLVTALYTLPFFPNRQNARSWAGFKIYMVAVCWVGVTVILPVINANAALGSDFIIVSVKRFILVVALLFIFEIIDLAWDDPHLKTVPQQIGIRNTKILGIILLLIFYALEFFQRINNPDHFLITLVMITLTVIFLLFAKENRSKYYTAFWVESIPIIWWLLFYLTLKF